MSKVQSSRWYPTSNQIDTPEKMQNTLRIMLDQHYALQDAHDKLMAATSAPSEEPSSPYPPGSGPTDTMICGLRVQPVDTTTLSNGATVKWNKSTGTFIVS